MGMQLLCKQRDISASLYLCSDKGLVDLCAELLSDLMNCTDINSKSHDNRLTSSSVTRAFLITFIAYILCVFFSSTINTLA